MQRIERYGVIALVFLLVTILAVSLWGESKDGGFLGMFGSKKPSPEAKASPKRAPNAAGPAAAGAIAPTPAAGTNVGDRMLPLHQPAPGTAAPANPATTGQDPYAALRAPGALPTPATAGNAAPAGASPAGAPLGAHPLAAGGAQPPSTYPGQPAGQNPLAAPVVRGATQPVPSREYVVKTGDTLGEIASRELGSAARWTEIQKLNGGLAPEKLRVGMKLKLPAGAAASVASSAAPTSGAAKPAAAAGGRTYVVQSGDTLGEIASRELGSAARWTEIQKLNPTIDPSRLAVGTKLTLPASSAPRVASAAPKAASERIAYAPPTAGKKSRVQ
jgi:nucleoid-associated protein YgaU